MKFWKLSLLSALAFFTIASMVLHSACTIDTCSGVRCSNGGACIDGYCQCPTGFEGANCNDSTVAKFLGTYAGQTQCGVTPAIFDTAIVYLDQFPLNVGIVVLSHRNDPLWGTDTLRGSVSGANIIVPDYNTGHFSRHVAIVLSGTRLNIYDQETLITERYEHGIKYVDTTNTVCNFYGTRPNR